MSVLYFIIRLLIISVSYAEENRDRVKSEFNDIFEFNEGRNFEIDITKDLSDFRTEVIGNLNNINNKIPDDLEDIINSKFKALERRLPGNLEGYLENKFSIIEKNNKENFEKLQNYVDTKLSSLENHIYRKIDAMEQNLLDKTDANIINHKLDALKKIQFGLDRNSTCSLSTNENSALLKEILNNKFADLEDNIFNTTNKIRHECSKFEAFESSLAELQKNLDKIAPELQIIRNKFDVLDNKLPQLNENKVNLNMEKIENKILSLNQSVINELHTLNSQVSNNMNHALGEVRNQFPSLELNINKKIDDLNRLYMSECKKLSVNRFAYAGPYVGINDEALNNVVVKYDSANNVDFFELHFAIKSGLSVPPQCILLTTKTDCNPDKDISFEVCIQSRAINIFKLRQVVATAYNLIDLSERHYTAFFIKIKNGNLEVGRRGSSSPLLNYSDLYLKTMKYFRFGGRHNFITRYLYDCPVF